MIYTLDNIFAESLKDNPVKCSKILRASDKWKQYKLEETIIVQLSNHHIITMHKGFEWDLSSVPRLFWSILPPNGDFIIGALIHDYLYQNAKSLDFGRLFADREMLKWSKAVNGTTKISLQKIDNYTRYYGVRLFGWLVWKNEKR